MAANETLVVLHGPGGIPGIPGIHGPGVYLVDYAARTVRAVPTAPEDAPGGAAPAAGSPPPPTEEQDAPARQEAAAPPVATM